MMYGFLIILILAAISSFFSFSEISLAASRRMKLRSVAEGGDARAARILSFQDQPGLFFTTVQIGLNAVAILAGIVGDSLSSYFAFAFQRLYNFGAPPRFSASSR